MVTGCTSVLVKLWSVTTSQFNEIEFTHNAISTFIGRFGQVPVASQQQCPIQTIIDVQSGNPLIEEDIE